MSFDGSIKTEIYSKLDDYLANAINIQDNEKLYVEYDGRNFSISNNFADGGGALIPDRFLARYMKDHVSKDKNINGREYIKENLKKIRRDIKPLAKIKNNIIAFFNKNTGCNKLEKSVIAVMDNGQKYTSINIPNSRDVKKGFQYQMAQNIIKRGIDSSIKKGLNDDEKSNIKDLNKNFSEAYSIRKKEDENLFSGDTKDKLINLNRSIEKVFNETLADQLFPSEENSSSSSSEYSE